jgi:hypothetical protein
MRRALVALLLLVAAAPAGAEELPRVELYTMGSGDDVFEAFGHAALCVISAEEPRGLCYNYGAADFTRPVGLTWDVLRGRARFFVSRLPLPLMIEAYREDDRTLYRQRLALPREAAVTVAERLAHDVRPENKYYTYHHYRDNCSTRLRDHLDIASGGRLAAGTERGSGATFRELTQRGFNHSIWLLAGLEILVGRRVDREATVWEAMFLPRVLRAEAARAFGAEPELVYRRRGPVPTLSPLAGRRAVLAAAALLTLLVVAGAAAGERAFRLTLGLAGLVVGLAGLLAAALAAVALLPELRRNEVLLVCLPTDLALLFLRGRARDVYVAARVVLALLVAAGLLAGALRQPMWAAWALATGPLLVALARAGVSARRRSR